MLGINVQDNSEDALAFLASSTTTYPQLRSVGDERSEAFGSTGVPENFLVDPQRPAGADLARRRSTSASCADSVDPIVEGSGDGARSPALILACGRGAAPRRSRCGADQVNISDVEDEVMCPICGTLLELSESPQARREKAFVAETDRRRQEQGGDQGRPGRRVRPRGPRPARGLRLRPLRLPGAGDRLRSLAAVALAVGVAALATAAAAAATARQPPRGAAEGEDAERLDADIARYDL